MDYDGFGRKLSKDEQAVLDHVTGLTRVLPEPSGEPCEDRQYVGELMAMRSRLGAMAIEPPRMRLSLDDVLKAADEAPQSPRDNKVIDWFTGRWGVGLVTAASVCLAVLTGAIATGELRALFDGSTPATADRQDPPLTTQNPPPLDSPGLITRRSSLSLQHDKPAEVQRLVADLVTAAGGRVTGLTRQGSGENASVEMDVELPDDRYMDFTAQLGGIDELVGTGEVVRKLEFADGAARPYWNSRLADAEDYLARLNELIATPSDLAALQDLDQERRKTRREIETCRRAIHALDTGRTLSRIDIQITSTPGETSFARAWDDGVDVLKETGAFLLKAGVAGSPILLIGALMATTLRRRRRMRNRAA